MATGISVSLADALLAAVFNGTAFPTYANPFIQLHVGDPGPDGTANVAGESTRQQASGTFVVGTGSTTNPTAISWSAVSTSETYSYVSLWSAATGGTFLASGTITANPVVAGDNFVIPSNDVSVTMPTAT